MRALVLPVHDIDEQGKDYAFPLSAAWLEEALAGTQLRPAPGAEPGALEVHAQRNGVEFFVQGEVRADLVVDCVRCLGDVPLPIRVAISTLLSPRKDGDAAREVELEDDDIERGYYEGHELVLDELVREHLVLEVPMQPLCSQDCKGIAIPEHLRPKPQDFGGEGAIDPRLAPLNQLRAKLSEKE
jgi:uncharacterized protein